MAYNTKLGYTFTTDGDGVKNHTYAEIDIDAETVTKTTWQYPEADSPEGIINIEISPELTLTPTMDSVLPVEYEGTAGEQHNITMSCTETLTIGDTYTVTVAPSDGFTLYTQGGALAGMGEAITAPIELEDPYIELNLYVVQGGPGQDLPADNYMVVNLTITHE